MKTSKISFSGKLTIRTFNPVSSENIVKTIRTKKQDDVVLLKLAKDLNPQPFNWARKNLASNQTKELDALFEKILKQKLPDESYIRSISSPTDSFLYLITHPETLDPKPIPTLAKGGIAIDFNA